VVVAGAVGGADAGFDALERFLGAAEFGQCLRGHLVGGDVVGIVADEGGELGQGCVGVALREMLHGEAVAGEGVGGIELQNFVERGELVHTWIVVALGEKGLTPMTPMEPIYKKLKTEDFWKGRELPSIGA
jgi:hypothetical protein